VQRNAMKVWRSFGIDRKTDNPPPIGEDREDPKIPTA
jgi:hypothetical protein